MAIGHGMQLNRVVNVLPGMVRNTNKLIKRGLASTDALSGMNTRKQSKNLEWAKSKPLEKS